MQRALADALSPCSVCGTRVAWLDWALVSAYRASVCASGSVCVLYMPWTRAWWTCRPAAGGGSPVRCVAAEAVQRLPPPPTMDRLLRRWLVTLPSSCRAAAGLPFLCCRSSCNEPFGHTPSPYHSDRSGWKLPCCCSKHGVIVPLTAVAAHGWHASAGDRRSLSGSAARLPLPSPWPLAAAPHCKGFDKSSLAAAVAAVWDSHRVNASRLAFVSCRKWKRYENRAHESSRTTNGTHVLSIRTDGRKNYLHTQRGACHTTNSKATAAGAPSIITRPHSLPWMPPRDGGAPRRAPPRYNLTTPTPCAYAKPRSRISCAIVGSPWTHC